MMLNEKDRVEMYEQKKLEKSSKKLVACLIAIILVFLTSCLTVLMLKSLISKEHTQTNTTKVTTTAVGFIKAYNDNLSTVFKDGAYGKQINLSATLKYKLENKAYEISINSKNSLLESVTKNGNTDISKVKDRTVAFLKQQGFTPLNMTFYNTDHNIEYKTYSNNSVICQSSSPSLSYKITNASFYELVCVDKKAVQNVYIQIDKYLALYKKEQQLSNFSQAIIDTNKKDNISYVIISLNSTDKHQKLLFATTGDNWEYLGDLIAGGKKYANGKYSITPEVQAKIDDKKYNGFIADALKKA